MATDPDLRAALERLIVQWDKSADMHADLYQKAVYRRDTVNSDRQEAYTYAAQPHAKQLREILAVVRASQPQVIADPNDGAFGQAAYCHHRHHLDEHTSNFDTCSHSICTAARIAASSRSPSPEQTR